MCSHLIAISLAFVIDKIIGDPSHWPHPVRWIGKVISFLEKRWNKGRNRKWKGSMMLFFVLFTSVSFTFMIIYLFYHIHFVAGVIVEAVIISTTIAQKSLKIAALDVYIPLVSHDFGKARNQLSYIVGRDTEGLGEAEITRGAVETVAENTCDGVTAPLFWAFFGGAPLAIAYRAINTCDSMVGYKNERFFHFGWASAKLDDLMNWIPSRLTGLLMLIVMHPQQTKRRTAMKILLRDAKRHPSPNSGWGEAATAAMLGVQLGGENVYEGVVSYREKMGNALVPLAAKHIKQAITIMERTSLLFLGSLWIGGIVIEMAYTWCKSALFI